MINFDLQILHPFSNRWESIASKHKKFGANKAWEANVYKTHCIISLSFRFTTRTDHAGLNIQAGLFGYEFEFHFYDIRHWDEATNKWAKYDYS
jgi:hypothetical protein